MEPVVQSPGSRLRCVAAHAAALALMVVVIQAATWAFNAAVDREDAPVGLLMVWILAVGLSVDWSVRIALDIAPETRPMQYLAGQIAVVCVLGVLNAFHPRGVIDALQMLAGGAMGIGGAWSYGGPGRLR